MDSDEVCEQTLWCSRVYAVVAGREKKDGFSWGDQRGHFRREDVKLRPKGCKRRSRATCEGKSIPGLRDRGGRAPEKETSMTFLRNRKSQHNLRVEDEIDFKKC